MTEPLPADTEPGPLLPAAHRVHEAERRLQMALWASGEGIWEWDVARDRVTIDRRRIGQKSGDGPPQCSRCNTILAAGAAFCDQCGHPAGA